MTDVVLDTNCHQYSTITRMWANAQRDGRPAEYRWRPSVQRRKVWWLTPSRPTRVPCSNDAKTRKPLKSDGVPQTNETISATSGPKFTILCGHVEEILLLNNFFSIVDTRLSCERFSPTELCNGTQMATFCVIFASCLSSEPRTAHFRPAF